MSGKGMSIDLESQPFTREGFLKFKQTLKMLVVGLLVLAAVTLAFAILTIYLVVLAKDNRSDIDDINKGVHGEQGLSLSSSSDPVDGFSLVSSAFQGSGYWAVRNTLPFKRSDQEAAAIGNEIYVVGGNDATGDPTDEIFIFNAILGSFTDGPKIPVKLARFALVHVPSKAGDKLYLIGGLKEADGDQVGEVHILDINSGDWSKGPELITPRSDFCGSYIDGKIYIAGGWPVAYEETLGSVEVLDLKKNKWEEVTSLPTPRGDCKCARLSDEFVVIGGYYDPEDQWRSDSFRDEVEAYDPKTQSWRTLASLPNARGDKAVVSLPNNRLLVMGGETHHKGERTGVATHHVEEYLGDHDMWVHRAPLVLPRFRTAAAYADGTVFLFGGHAVCSLDEESSNKECPETDEIQAFYDVDHPDVFLLEKE